MYTKYIEFYSINKIGTSETLRNETVITTENVKSITVHCLPRSIELNGDQFGHSLVGLIDVMVILVVNNN